MHIRHMSRRLTAVLSVCLLLGACATAPPAPSQTRLPPDIGARQRMAVQAPAKSASDLGLRDRLFLQTDYSQRLPPEIAGKLYSFRAQEMPLLEALALFASAYQLNVIADTDVKGTITVDFQSLPIQKAMESLVAVHGYYWKWEDGIIRVGNLETKTFTIDYIRLTRGSTASSQAGISGGGAATTGTAAATTSTAASSSTGGASVNFNQQNQIPFWDEVEAQVKSMLSPEGKLVLNRLSGTVQITDRHRQMLQVEKFLASLTKAMHRQVEVDAKIYEVTLQADSSLGVDWTKLSFLNSTIKAANIIANPAGGIALQAATLGVTHSTSAFQAVINLLEQHGKVSVVSQPRLVTLNNQTAMMKVGTDRTFYSVTSTVSIIAGTTPTTQTVSTEIPTVVTDGLVLWLTPQISADGWIMVDISPTITRISGTTKSPLGNTSPVLEVKQTTALLRLRDGETVVIGGLIQDASSDSERKIPVLGDLPFVGAAFRGTYNATTRKELVIFLTPRIMKSTSSG